jgi:hypothetical protein
MAWDPQIFVQLHCTHLKILKIEIRKFIVKVFVKKKR